MFFLEIPFLLATKGGESSVGKGEMVDSPVVHQDFTSLRTCKGRHAEAQEAEDPLKAPEPPLSLGWRQKHRILV